jgi:hypothetical protein
MFTRWRKSVAVVSLFIIVLSVIVGILILPWLRHSVIIDVALVFTFACLFYFAFERWLWHFPLWQKLGIVQIPDLRGAWQGTLTTSYDGNSQVYPIRLQVDQTWRTLHITLISRTSRSTSLTAVVRPHHQYAYELSYVYHAKPRDDNQPDEIQAHTGLCNLLYDDNRQELKGRYHYYHEDDSVAEFVHGKMVLKRPSI